MKMKENEIFEIGSNFKVILKKGNLIKKRNHICYVKNTGANAIVNILIEVSPDGKNFVELLTNMKNNLNAGEMTCVKLENCAFNYFQVRCQASDNSQTSIKAWLDSN